MAIVEVRPLPLKRWHGKDGKESFSNDKGLEVLFDVDAGGYATGLTDEEAKIYGEKMGVDLSSRFDPEAAHPYWSSKAAKIPLRNSTTLFNTAKAADYVKVKNMKASKIVANSLKEWEDGKYPDATHFIYDEEEAIQSKATKIAVKNEAIKFAIKMSLDSKIAVIQIITKESVRKKSQDFIEVAFDDILQTKPEEFLTLVKRGPEEVRLRGLISEAILRNILMKEVSGIYYMGELLAYDMEAALAWFQDPKNERTKVIIMERLTE